MNIIIPNLEDAFDVGHSEGKKEVYGKILTLINDGCELDFIKAYVKMELAHHGLPTVKGVLRNVSLSGNVRSVRDDAPSGRNDEGDEK